MFENINNLGSGYYIWLSLLAFCLLSAAFVLSVEVKESEDYSGSKNFRKLSRQNVVKERINTMISVNMDYNKRKIIEDLIVQAGYQFSTFEFYLMKIGLASLLGFLFYFVLNNPIAGFVMGLIGFMAPKQALLMKKRARAEKLNTQVGTFINIVIGRYEMLNDFSESLRMSLEECYNQEPLATEIRKTVMDLDLGVSVNEALENMTIRTDNKFIRKLTTNYKISTDIGTKEARKKLLGYVIDEYNKESVAKAQLKKELKGPVMEAYLMCAMVPGVMMMQAFMTDGYVEFMTQDGLGKIGMAVIMFVVIGGIWFIKSKVGAPLE